MGPRAHRVASGQGGRWMARLLGRVAEAPLPTLPPLWMPPPSPRLVAVAASPRLPLPRMRVQRTVQRPSRRRRPRRAGAAELPVASELPSCLLPQPPRVLAPPVRAPPPPPVPAEVAAARVEAMLRVAAEVAPSMLPAPAADEQRFPLRSPWPALSRRPTAVRPPRPLAPVYGGVAGAPTPSGWRRCGHGGWRRYCLRGRRARGTRAACAGAPCPAAQCAPPCRAACRGPRPAGQLPCPRRPRRAHAH